MFSFIKKGVGATERDRDKNEKDKEKRKKEKKVNRGIIGSTSTEEIKLDDEVRFYLALCIK